MGFLDRLFGAKANDPTVAALNEIVKLVEDEKYQNSLLEPDLLKLVLAGDDCDEVQGAHGIFGFVPSNPIPVNGVLGELAYLSKLRTENGERLFFQRVGALDLIDVFEAVTWSGLDWFIFYVDPYHPRRSRKAPQGFHFSGGELSQFTGFRFSSPGFPLDFAECRADEVPDILRIGYLAVDTADAALEAGTFNRTETHKLSLQNSGLDIRIEPSTNSKTAVSKDVLVPRLSLLLSFGRRQGYLTYTDIYNQLPDRILESLGTVYVAEMMKELGVPVYENAPARPDRTFDEIVNSLPSTGRWLSMDRNQKWRDLGPFDATF